jgi:hypothetical protein
VPDFYRQALAVEPRAVRQAAQELQEQFAALESQVDEGRWQARFTSQQINAWLVQHLAKEFPGLVPPGVKEPRVSLRGDRVFAAARYQHRQLDTVVSLEASVRLSDQPNVLHVTIHRLAAGALELPLAPFTQQVSRIALAAGLEIRWLPTESQPAALVTVPCAHHQYDLRPMLLETCEICDGAVVLSGASGVEAIEAIGTLPRDYRMALLEIHHD